VAARQRVGFVEGFETDFAMNQSAHIFEMLLEAGQAGHLSGRHDAGIGDDIGSKMLTDCLRDRWESIRGEQKLQESSRRQLNDCFEVVTGGKQVEWWSGWVQVQTGNAPCGPPNSCLPDKLRLSIGA
jgi:hypothetical protein